MSREVTAFVARIGLLAACALCAAGDAGAVLYWQSDVRARDITVCFVGDAVTTRAARVRQIESYLTDYGYAANIRFNYLGQCPAASPQSNGNDYFDGDIRVALPATSAVFTGMVPGKGCQMFLDNGKYNGGNDGGGSWSNSPRDLPSQRACLYNLKLNDDGDASGVPWRNHSLHEFGHALGLAHEHERTDVDRTICSADWIFWANNTGSWPATSLLLCSQNYNQTELINLLNLPQPAGKEDASVLLARPLIADKLDAYYGVNSASLGAAVATGEHDLITFKGKLPYGVGKTSITGMQMVLDGGGLETGYGGGASSGLMTPYDRDSVMHYQFSGCGINGNYDNTGLSTMDRLGVHILYPEEGATAEYVGATVVRKNDPVHLQAAWKVRGANMNYVASGFQWRVNGTLISTSPEMNAVLPAGVNTFSYTHSDFLGRVYYYEGTITVLAPADYDNFVAGINAENASLL